MGSKQFYYIPSGIDEAWLASLIPTGSKYSLDDVKFFINNLGYVYTRQQENLISEGFVYLHSTILQGHSRQYKEIIDLLLLNGVIERNRSYVVNSTSRGYRFSYTSAKEVYSSIVTKTVHIKKLTKERASFIPFPLLNKWFNDPRLHFDAKKARTIVQAKYENKVGKGGVPLAPIYYRTIAQIENKDFVVGRDQTSYRFHSPLTSIKSDLRKCYRFDGKELFQIDIKGSQPYISQALLNPTFYTTTLPSIFTSTSTSSNTYKNTSTTYMLVKKLLNADNQAFMAFINDVNSGVFYEQFLKQIKRSNRNKYNEIKKQALFQLIQSENVNSNFRAKLVRLFPNKTAINNQMRKIIKKVIYQVLFSDNLWINNGNPIPKFDASLKMLFKQIYPEVYQVFHSIKCGDKSHLAVILQRIESYLIIDTCCKLIGSMKPDVPLFTIHDSIVTTKEHLELVKGIILEEFEKLIGETPKIKCEPL
jgi:hypothetical protein